VPFERLKGMIKRLLPAVVTLLVTATAAAQDVEFIRALESAQKARPATLSSTSRIAPESEPGSPLVIHGRAFAADRKTPLANAVVFAYHTDKEGLYDRPGTSANSWRLRGWAKTDGEGRFEFQTIRPGAYPGRNVAEHVHFTVFTPSGERYHAGELNFADDKLVSAAERAASEREGDFGGVRPVRREGPVQHVDFRVHLEPRQKF
jgi:protocatechuate 3,4-dioxygenase beta subunit